MVLTEATIAALGTALGAGISTGGGLIGGAVNNQQASNASWQGFLNNLYLQKQNQEWQTEMSNTAHQREVEDLRAAGLNPLLSVNSGAAVGSSPGNSTVMAGNGGTEINRGLNAAGQAMINLASQVAQIKNMQAQATLYGQQALTQETTRELQMADINLKNADLILKNKDINWYERRMAETIKKMSSETLLNNAKLGEVKSNIELNRAKAGEASAKTWRMYREPLGIEQIYEEITGQDNWNVGGKLNINGGMEAGANIGLPGGKGGGTGAHANYNLNGGAEINGNRAHGRSKKTTRTIWR